MDKRLVIVVCLLIVFFGVYTVTFNHNPNQTTIYSASAYDEYRNLNVVEGILKTGLPTLLGLNYWQHPPVPFYIDAAISKLFNIDPQQASSYLMPILGGLTIAFTFLLAEEVLGNSINAAIISVITGFMPYVWGAFGVFLNDGFVMFFSVLSFYLLFKFTKEPTWQKAVYLGACLALGLLCKITFFPVIIIVVAALYFNRQTLKLYLVLAASFLLVSLPYYVYRLLNTTQGYFGLFGDSSTFLTVGGIGSSNQAVTFNQLLAGLNTFYPWVLVLLTLIGLILLIQTEQEQRNKLLLLLWFIGLFIVCSSVSQYKDFRYFISIIPFTVILAGTTLNFLLSIPNLTKIKVGVTLVLVVYLFSLSTPLLTNQGTFDKQTNLVKLIDTKNVNYGVVLSDGNHMELAYNAGLYGLYIDKYTNPSDFIKYNTNQAVINGSLKTFSKAFQNTFTVTIKDNFGKPVNGAIITIPDLNWVSRSNEEGVARFPFMPANYQGGIVIEALCKQPIFVTVKADPNGVFTLKEWFMQDTSCLVNGLSEYRY